MTNLRSQLRLAVELTFLMALATSLGACKRERGMLVTHETLCKPENNGKRVTIAGYLTSSGMMTFCSHGTCSLSLRNKKSGGTAITVGLYPGGGKNHMEDLPEKFSAKDLKFTTNEGKEVGNMAFVMVTGRALTGQGCQLLDVDLIESADAMAAPAASASAAAAPSL